MNSFWQRKRGAALLVAFFACIVGLTPIAAKGQIPTNEHWKTIATVHFRVHFTTPLEHQARHAASVAERAYANLATELARPRGLIDIVISDGTDASNGSATVVPRPTVIMFARPPVDEPSLEGYDDWSVLVLQHELTHIFHLDRSLGWWRTAQSVFGRNPVLFPNYYTPSWLTEGLAVYYESRFTSGGRLHGSFETAIARSAAIDGVLPPLSELSLATSRFPYGQSVYVYGSFVWDELARSHGPASVPAFVERASGEPIPFLLNREAKRTFGETFTQAWDRWRDSVVTAVSDPATFESRSDSAQAEFTSAQATQISNGGRYLVEPRWISDSAIIFVANDGRSTSGLYRVKLGGTPTRIARRNSLDTNDPATNGSIVFAQGDYIDRFHTRGDLYMAQGGRETRLTTDKRLAEPSVRDDGSIVAVQTEPGTTRLVTVSGDGRNVVPLTVASLDTQWTAPRWSPDGNRIAAVRITGAYNEIAVLDSTGGVLSVPVRERAVVRSLAWTPDGRTIVFTSDIDGTSQLWKVSADASVGGVRPHRLTWEPGGVYGADVVNSGADSLRVVTTALRGDGYHLLVWTVPREALVTPVGNGGAHPVSATQLPAPASGAIDPRWLVSDDTSRARSYSPWRSLAPAYWSPTFATAGGDHGDLLGALTGGSDAIGRHRYIAQAAVNVRNSNVDASLSYAYNRWINPMVTVALEQSWTYSAISRGGNTVGVLDRRTRFASLHATFARPRARTYSALTVGAELEQREYGTTPGSLRAQLNSFYTSNHQYPALVAAAVFSNAQRPALSISPEDGVTLTGSVRQRWEQSAGSAGRSGVLIASGYKSLDLPGFAHHVLAVRAALGAADRRTPGEFEVGGVSGSSFEIVPGITFGSAARTFPVRGFAAGSETGISASSISAEYRVPLIAPSRSWGLFPFFLDRASLSLFGDAARAWCPATAVPACSPSSNDGPSIASIGGELNLDSALQFDTPYRFRFGVAHPVHGGAYAGASSLSGYATLGLAF